MQDSESTPSNPHTKYTVAKLLLTDTASKTSAEITNEQTEQNEGSGTDRPWRTG